MTWDFMLDGIVTPPVLVVSFRRLTFADKSHYLGQRQAFAKNAYFNQQAQASSCLYDDNSSRRPSVSASVRIARPSLSVSRPGVCPVAGRVSWRED